MEEGEGKGEEQQRWVLQFRDLPEVSRQRAVTSRYIADIPITSGNPIDFMKALDYSYVSLFFFYRHPKRV